MSNSSISIHLASADRGVYPFLGATGLYTASGYKICNDQDIASGTGNGEVLVLGEIAAPAGFVFVQNNDATNYVELALDLGMTKVFSRLNPGEFAFWCPSAATAIYARAHTAQCTCTVIAAATMTAVSAAAHAVGMYGTSGLKASYQISLTVAGDTISSLGDVTNAAPSAEANADVELRRWIISDSYLNIVPADDPQYIAIRNLGNYPVDISTDDAGLNKVATLPALGAPMILPVHSTGTLYAGIDSIVEDVPIAVLHVNKPV